MIRPHEQPTFLVRVQVAIAAGCERGRRGSISDDLRSDEGNELATDAVSAGGLPAENRQEGGEDEDAREEDFRAHWSLPLADVDGYGGATGDGHGLGGVEESVRLSADPEL